MRTFLLVLVCVFSIAQIHAVDENLWNEQSQEKPKTEVSIVKMIFGDFVPFQGYNVFDLQFSGGALIIDRFKHPDSWKVVPNHPQGSAGNQSRAVSLNGEMTTLPALMFDAGVRPFKFLRLGYAVNLPMKNHFYENGLMYEQEKATVDNYYTYLKMNEFGALHGPKASLLITVFEEYDTYYEPGRVVRSSYIEIGGQYWMGDLTLENGWDAYAKEQKHRQEKIDISAFTGYMRFAMGAKFFKVGVTYEIGVMTLDYDEGKEKAYLHRVTLDFIFRF